MSEGRSEPAAEQTLRIRFQRLRPTPSPAAVICVRGSMTLRGIKRPAGTSRVQRDSGQRGGLRQRRWFISALPGRALGSQRLPGSPGSWAGKRPRVFRGGQGLSLSGNRGPRTRQSMPSRPQLKRGQAASDRVPPPSSDPIQLRRNLTLLASPE